MLNCIRQQLSEEAVSLHVRFLKDFQTEKSVKERLVKMNHTPNKGIEQTMFFSLHYMVINTRITLALTIYNPLYWFPPLPLTLLSGDQHKLIRYWDNWCLPHPFLTSTFCSRHGQARGPGLTGLGRGSNSPRAWSARLRLDRVSPGTGRGQVGIAGGEGSVVKG